MEFKKFFFFFIKEMPRRKKSFESIKFGFFEKYTFSLAGWVHIRSGLNFEVFQMKKIYDCLHEGIGCKSEFGFDTVTAIRGSFAKRMLELLHPIPSWRANLYLYKTVFERRKVL